MADTGGEGWGEKGSRSYSRKTRWIPENLLPRGRMSCLTIRERPYMTMLSHFLYPSNYMASCGIVWPDVTLPLTPFP
jgi:hypothetical protein